MSWLDKLGKKALDAIDSAARVAEEVKQRVEPILDRTPIGGALRRDASDDEVPMPEPNTSPFAPPPAPEPESEPPLARPEMPAQVFGNGTDPWTGRALQVLTERNIEHEFVDLEAEGGGKIESRLLRETGGARQPFVFLRGEYIGGFNALDEVDRLGQLEEMTKPPEERGQGRVRVVIPRRTDDAPPPGEQR